MDLFEKASRLLALSFSEAIRKERIYPLVKYIPLEDLVKLSSNEMRQLGVLKKNRTLEDASVLAKSAEQVRRECQEKGIRLVTIFDEEYPFYLKNIYNPPLVIYYKGVLKNYLPREGFYLAFIGTRRSDDNMNLLAKKIAYEFSLRRGHVISGLAKGIDGFSHQGACLAKKPTTAVLANGLDIYYPFANRDLYHKILDNGGCIISEYPPSSKPLEYRFPMRNRIISALSEGIFVLQSPRKSGVKITVNYGIEAGKNIYVYSHFPKDNVAENFLGNQELLDMGATPIENLSDFLEKITSSPSFKLLKKTNEDRRKSAANSTAERETIASPLDRNNMEDSLLHLVKDSPKSVNELSMTLKMETEKIYREVMKLLFKGKIKELPNKKYYQNI